MSQQSLASLHFQHGGKACLQNAQDLQQKKNRQKDRQESTQNQNVGHWIWVGHVRWNMKTPKISKGSKQHQLKFWRLRSGAVSYGFMGLNCFEEFRGSARPCTAELWECCAGIDLAAPNPKSHSQSQQMFNFQFCYSWTRWLKTCCLQSLRFCHRTHAQDLIMRMSKSVHLHPASATTLQASQIITKHHKSSQLQMKCQSVDVYMRTQQYQNNANAANKWNVKKRQPTVSVVEDLPAYFCCAFSSQHLLEFSVHLWSSLHVNLKRWSILPTWSTAITSSSGSKPRTWKVHDCFCIFLSWVLFEL